MADKIEKLMEKMEPAELLAWAEKLKKEAKAKAQQATAEQESKVGKLIRKHKAKIYECAGLDDAIKTEIAKIFGDALPGDLFAAPKKATSKAIPEDADDEMKMAS